MALAAVHMDPDTFRVLGVWLSEHDSSYVHTSNTARAKQLARETMSEKGPVPTWDEWCRQLAERWPVAVMWQAVPRKDGEEARHVLARVLATEAVNRRAAEE